MGNLFSSLCEKMVTPASQLLCHMWSYVHNLPENLTFLEKAMELLKAKRDDVKRRVDREEFTRRQRRLVQVELWLNNVVAIENEVSDLLSTNEIELQRLCVCTLCFQNLEQSYLYGERVILKLKEVENLTTQGEFAEVVDTIPIGEVEELPIQQIIVGQKKLLKRVWNHLMKDGVGIVGLYGMGGVGKTTLLTQINNKFIETSGIFDVVIWVVVSKGATIRKIQGDIARKLGFRGEEWAKENENERAIDIHIALKRKKFVLLLDDIWEKVNFEAVGIPYPSIENRCKVAFTTRSKEVCGRMRVDDPIKIVGLNRKKSWKLFQKKIGVKKKESHSKIYKLAKEVASKCCGLPLALNLIGETMACITTVQEWHHAVNVLTSSAAEFSGMENEILPISKYSYDNLGGEQMKSCFLYCCLLPEDYEIQKYWKGKVLDL